MRMLTAAAGAAFLVLIAGPALAGDRDGGRGCGGGCGSRPPPPPACCHGDVSASARASARAYVSARTYEAESIRRGYGGETVYVGGYGGYGDFDGYGGAAYYRPIETLGPACPSAPFGYVVSGYGRDDFRPSWCGYREHEAYDRGGRYGYSARRESRAYDSYEAYESYDEYDAWEEGYVAEDHHRSRDCDCHGDRPPAPYPPPYLPEPPRYEPPRPERPRTHRPHRPRPSRPPRQEYRQEPGERG